jgi:hypothetical protein
MSSDTELAPKIKRRPRFAAPANPPRVEITDRDLELLSIHQLHRFLATDQAAKLMPDHPPKKIIERIGKLNAAGLLDRPRAQVEYYRVGGGSRPIVHAISTAGARILQGASYLYPGRVTWSHKNDSATRPFIQHTLEIVDLAVALNLACRKRPGTQVLVPPALTETLPAVARDADAPYKLKATITHNGTRTEAGVVPDLPFLLTFPDRSRRAFLAELDRGTMPIERSSITQTSIIKKCLTYHAAYEAWTTAADGTRRRLVVQHLGWKAFRVLIITPTAERADNIRSAIAENARLMRDGSPLFYVADKPTIDAAPDLLAFDWLAADGSRHRLTP